MNIPDVPVTFTSAEYPPIDSGAMFLYQGAGLTVLNRSSRLPKVRSVGIVPYAETSNALVFVDSSLGVSPNYGLKAALFKPEPDYFSPGHLMAGVGRYLLFEIINPTPRPRLVFWFTRSLDVFGNTLLPRNITVYGRSKQDIALGGSGSARIVSQPLTPLEVDGHYYIALDLNEDPRYGDVPRGRLASLYNADLIKDDRAIDGFSRDISIVSERDARASVTPQSLSTFPADLSRCCVQYSGLYEDGWASQDSWFQLRSDSDSGALVIDGSIPSGISTSRARVEIDGRTVWTQTLYPGEFVFTIPLPPHFSPGDHRIGLHFDASRILGTGDARHASALLGSISFQAS